AGRAIAIFCLAASLGCGLIWWKADQAAAPRIEREQLFAGEAIIERVQPMAAEGVIRLVIRPSATGLPPRLRVNIDAAKAPAGLETGARIRLRAWLMPPAPMAVPGGYNF